MPKFLPTDMTGVIPAVLTVFDENEKVDEARTREYVNYLINCNVNGLYIGGSTGECFLMSIEERKRIAEIVIDEVANRVPVIVHIADIGTAKSIELARHAEKCGADAISAVPPFYFQFSTKNILHYYQDICASVNIPMIVYNIALAGEISMPLLKEIFKIENVSGIKFTLTTVHQIEAMRKMKNGPLMVYTGYDSLAAAGISYGADGIIGTFYNIIPDLFIGIYNAVKNNDIKKAIELQSKANAINRFFHGFDEESCFSAMRFALSLRGIQTGKSMRPFLPLSDESKNRFIIDAKKLYTEYNLQGVELFDIICAL